MKYNKDTVRKNVTVSKELSDNLEQASWCTGASQSAIIEAAFRQPSMKRLFAFCRCGDGEDCVVNLLDAHASLLDTYADGHAAGRAIIGVLVDEYLPVLMMKPGVSTDEIRGFHEYARQHMSCNCINSSSAMRGYANEFDNGTFYCSQSDSFKVKLRGFMHEMLSGQEFLVDSYLYRILAYVFESLMQVPENVKDDIMKTVFGKLCEDKRVFGITPAWA